MRTDTQGPQGAGPALAEPPGDRPPGYIPPAGWLRDPSVDGRTRVADDISPDDIAPRPE